LNHDSTTADSITAGDPGSPERPLSDAIVVIWSREDAAHVGDALLVPRERDGRSFVFGRGTGDEGRRERLHLVRQRPGANQETAPLVTPQLSRVQWIVRRHPDGGVEIENAGKRELLFQGKPVTRVRPRPGDVVEIGGQLVFVCTERPLLIPAMRVTDRRLWPAFGAADAFGYVGESPEAWRLRDELGVVAKRSEHVLVLGGSGVGKELVAQALHAMSGRAGRKLVSRNAATVPAGLIDAEVFGNAPNYPNAGMPERPGLVGEADGGTLYLDEVGELPVELQTHFLRLLDDGDYQRLGDARRRTANLRVFAATNRPVGQLRADVVARFPIRIQAAGLHARREDVPLVAKHLLERLQAADDVARHREPARLSKELVVALTQHLYSTHVREMRSILFRALLESAGPVVELTAGARELLFGPSLAPDPPREVTREVTREDVVRALARHDGVRERAWRDLGLPSRHVLKRLMQRYAIGDDDA